MLIGMSMLLAPIIIFLATYPLSRKLSPRLRLLYRIVGAAVVLAGSGTSYYLAAYTGDQGGIGAFFFQVGVILVYGLFSAVLVIANRAVGKEDSGHSYGRVPKRVGQSSQRSTKPPWPSPKKT